VLHGFVRQRPISWPLRGAFAAAAFAMAVPQLTVQYAAVAFAVGLYLFLLREARQTDPAWSS
jgi:hypothetical protein